MPKPKSKKDELYATYNNDFCYEKALAELKKMDPADISIEPLDSHTLKIVLRKEDSEISNSVKSIVKNTRGYVEIDLEKVNALYTLNGKEKMKNEKDSDVLDTPFYG